MRRRRLKTLLYRLRTEASTPGEHAWSIAVGTLLGCFPVYGLHLVLAAVAGRILQLNRIMVYLGTHINNPFTAPILIFAEVQVGSFVLRGRFHELTLEAAREIDLLAFVADLAVGSMVLGVVLGAFLGALAHRVFRAMSTGEFEDRLVEACALAYLPSGFRYWELARAMLRVDPVFLEILRRGLLPDRGTLVDARCGRGMFLALVATYRRLESHDGRPDGWAAPPRQLALVGYDPRRRAARVARSALGDQATVERRDITGADFPYCTAIVLIHGLSRMKPDERRRFLEKAVAALGSGGRLVIRDRDGQDRLSHELRQLGLVVGTPELSGSLLFRRYLLVADKPGGSVQG
jgi:uncharacterized protein (DUF2062 family)